LAESQFEEGIRQILFFRQLQNLDRNCLRGFLRENNMEDMVKLKILLLIGLFFVCSSLLFAEKPPGDISIQAEGYGVSKSDALLNKPRSEILNLKKTSSFPKQSAR
jgi:hypothetical protein